MKNSYKTLILILSCAAMLTAASYPYLERWEEFTHTPEKTIMIEWIKSTARGILSKDNSEPASGLSLPVPPEYTGLFITLIKNGKVRGCYGAFSHRYNNPADILKDYIKGAIYLDPRHSPLEKYELDDTEIVLTVTSNPEPVDDVNNVDISYFGLFIECDDSSKQVIVPAEYKTSSKLLKLTGNRRCMFKKFRAVTIR